MYRKIDWDAITIKNNFLFQETLRTKSLCKQLLECILHIQVKTIRYMETEKTMKAQLSSKNTRLDVYVEDKYGNVADIEMQTTDTKNPTASLPKSLTKKLRASRITTIGG